MLPQEGARNHTARQNRLVRLFIPGGSELPRVEEQIQDRGNPHRFYRQETRCFQDVNKDHREALILIWKLRLLSTFNRTV